MRATSSINDSAIARTCLRAWGSALPLVMVPNTENSAAIARPTMTMKTMSSISVTPRGLVDIAGFRFDGDIARRRAVGHLDRATCARLAEGVEPERAACQRNGAGRRRVRK